MKIAVCDDEKIFLNSLCREIKDCFPGRDICFSRYSDGSGIAEAFAAGERFDMVFLDIEMKSMDGMSAAREIRRFDSSVPLIFLTSHTEMAPDGYEVNAFRFLQKPIIREKLRAAVSSIEKLPGHRKMILIKDSGTEHIVAADDIIYAQSDNNDVRFITAKKEYRARMKFAAALDLLNDGTSDFIKIHRCIIVNASHVSSYQNAEVRIDNGELLPVSKKLWDGFRNAMTGYIRRNAR